MHITWRDGITTLAGAAAVVLDWAHFHDWTWPLVSSARWMVAAIAVLSAIILAVGYVLDKDRDQNESALVLSLGIVIAGLTLLGLIFADSSYVVLMMIGALALWLTVTVRHLFEKRITMHHA